jgi:hypothetical protein
LKSEDAKGGAEPEPPELPGRVRSPYQLTFDFLGAIGDSSRKFYVTGGLIDPKYWAESYPVIGKDQIGTTLGRAFKLVWDEHPQLQADVKLFGLAMWNQHGPAGIGLLSIGLLGTIGAAAGGEWKPASLTTTVTSALFPEQTFDLASGPARPGDLFFRQGAFSLLESTPIGTNEGENQVGLFPMIQFRGGFLDRDLTFSTGFNARYLPERDQFRFQQSFGLDYNLVRFNLGDYKASFGTEGRFNTYQQIDLNPSVTATQLAPEGTFMFQFRITEPPVQRTSPTLIDRPSF